MGEKAEGISCPTRWTQATVQIHSHRGQISGSPTSAKAKISNSASLHQLCLTGGDLPLLPAPLLLPLQNWVGRRRQNHSAGSPLQETLSHPLEVARRGFYIPFTLHNTSSPCSPLELEKIILGVLKQALKISSSSINIKLSHSLWQRHLLKAIICLNSPHSVGRTWVMLRACCRMQSCIIL